MVSWACLCTWNLSAQERYLDEIFSDVIITPDTAFAQNISIFPVILGQSENPAAVPIVMDIYEPEGDTVSGRPLIVMAHTGTYFPPAVNGGATGTRKDSANVEIAIRFAKMGYVVANVSNRQGWIATSPDPEVKRETILQATYRGIHDVRSAIRFFRKTAVEDGNPFGIDTARVVIGGIGTGGYIAYGTAYVDDSLETQLTKFFNFDTQSFYVVQGIHGDPFGVTQTPLNIANFPSYSSAVSMGFALGGALGDTSWVEADEVPFVALHNPEDRFAPYDVSDVIEPVNLDVVIQDAAGGLGALRKVNQVGLNDIFKNDTTLLNDPITEVARQKTSELSDDEFLPGLLPITPPFDPCESQCVTSIPGAPADTCRPDGGPWHWFNEAAYAAIWEASRPGDITGEEAVCQSNLENPNLPDRSRVYIDTVIGYIAPRMFLALGLDSSDTTVTSIDNSLKEVVDLNVFPNPASQSVRINVNRPMLGLRMYDITGRSIMIEESIRNTQFEIDRNGVNAGMYILQIDFEEGSVTQKIMFE